MEKISDSVPKPIKLEKSCGCVVFTKHESIIKYLVIKHKAGLHWDFPKGHVEAGETEEMTALREVKEETGLTVSILPGFRHELKYSPKKGIEKTVVFFVAETQSTDVKISEEEVVGFKFLEYANALPQLTYSSASKMLEKANNFLKGIKE